MPRPLAPLLLLALAVSGCSAPPPDEQQQALAQAERRAEAAASAGTDAAPPADASACDATQAQWLVGKTPGQGDLDQARNDARATSVRVLRPDQPVTMEFSAARLNVEVDDKGVAVSVRCG